MLDQAAMDPWAMAVRIIGTGGVTLIIREILSRAWSTKKETLEAEQKTADMFRVRVKELDEMVDRMRGDCDKRVTGLTLEFEARLMRRSDEIHKYRNLSQRYLGLLIEHGYSPTVEDE